METRRCYFLCAMLVTGASSQLLAQDVIFVNAAAEAGGDGTFWHRAMATLDEALSSASAGDQVWVAAGTYRPGISRTDSFILREGIEIYGGFAGVEVPGAFHLGNRNLTRDETVLEGEIGVPGAADNSFHIIVAAAVTRSTVIDGVTIARAHASGLTQSLQDVGGGLLVLDASPTFRRCLFLDLQAGTRGAAVHIASGAPLFAHCRFVGNQTTVTQSANNLGGAVYYAGTTTDPAEPIFVNCLFVGNRAGVGNGGAGGALYGDSFGHAVLINCTLLHNRADTLTGGVFGASTVINSVLYGNQDRNGFELTAQLRGLAEASYSLIQGGWPGTGILNANPLFLDPLGADGVAGTIDDNATLQSGSPCIDAGDNLAWPDHVVAVDLNGFARFVNDPAAADTGRPPGVALSDLGAYETQFQCTTSSDCDDGLYCNGDESCLGGACQRGDAVDCTDSNPCTRDSCSESDRACMHAADGALCDNGIFCDGLEACDLQAGCVARSPLDCEDSVPCTIDQCNEETNQCDHAPDSSVCDDGQFCNGVETCEPAGCVAGALPCDSTGICDEMEDRCMPAASDCSQAADCEDGNICTDHACVSGRCETSFNQVACNDANPCTSADACMAGSCMGVLNANCGQPPVDPGPGGGDPPPPPEPEDELPPVSDDDTEEPPDSEIPPDEEQTQDPDVPPVDAPADSCVERGDCVTDSENDEDGDGVRDQFDLCPLTPSGHEVAINGCSEDQDAPGRGVLDVPEGRRCGMCGAMGLLGVFCMVGVPGVVLILGRWVPPFPRFGPS